MLVKNKRELRKVLVDLEKNALISKKEYERGTDLLGKFENNIHWVYKLRQYLPIILGLIVIVYMWIFQTYLEAQLALLISNEEIAKTLIKFFIGFTVIPLVLYLFSQFYKLLFSDSPFIDYSEAWPNKNFSIKIEKWAESLEKVELVRVQKNYNTLSIYNFIVLAVLVILIYKTLSVVLSYSFVAYAITSGFIFIYFFISLKQNTELKYKGK